MVYDRLRANGKPGKVALVAVMRKLIPLANALVRDDRTGSPAPSVRPPEPGRSAARPPAGARIAALATAGGRAALRTSAKPTGT